MEMRLFVVGRTRIFYVADGTFSLAGCNFPAIDGGVNSSRSQPSGRRNRFILIFCRVKNEALFIVQNFSHHLGL